MSGSTKVTATVFVVLFLVTIFWGLYSFNVANRTFGWNPPTKNPPENGVGFLISNTAWDAPQEPI